MGAELGAVFRHDAAGRAAQAAGLGIWPLDKTTSGFALSSQDSIGPNGTLILPKLFRRCTDYLRSRTDLRFYPELWELRSQL